MTALLAGRSVALVHEWFGATGGSETVFLRIGDLVPHAERYVLWRDPDATVDGLRQSWLGRTPLRRSKPLALPLMPLAWRTLTRARYDVVISSSHAFAHTVRLGHPDRTRYFSYVHSPARYLWSPRQDERGASRLLAAPRGVLRGLDRRLGRHVHSYAANSREVQGRIRRYWRRDARVIHPPVDVAFFGAAQRTGGEYLLGVGRWVGYKNFDLMIAIAARARVPLVLAGSGPQEARLRSLAAGSNVPVRFEVRPSRERLRELYAGALALLFPAHEDFGIIPVEAQAAGTPVIGLRRGGLLETVVEGETGFLVDSLDARAHAALVARVGGLDPATIRARADRFAPEVFAAGVARWLAEEAGEAPGAGGTGAGRR